MSLLYNKPQWEKKVTEEILLKNTARGEQRILSSREVADSSVLGNYREIGPSWGKGDTGNGGENEAGREEIEAEV